MADVRFAPEPQGPGRVTPVCLLPEDIMISGKNHNSGWNYCTQHVSVQTHLRKKSQTFFGQKWARGPSFLCRKAPTAHFCIPFAVGLALCMLCCRTTGLSTGLCGSDRLSVRWGSCLAARPCQPARGKWIRSSSDSSFIWQGARHQPAPLKVQLPASDVKCLQKIQAFGCRRKAVLHIRTLPSACFPWTDCCYLLCNEKADMNVYSARDSTAAEHKLQALNVGNHFTPH